MINRFRNFVAKRRIKMIVIHCSATPKGMSFDVNDIRSWHVNDRGWRDVGYHFVIKIDGTIQKGRSIEMIGAGVKGFNKHSIHICYIGGKGGEDTRTLAQVIALRSLVEILKADFPKAEILGHRDLSPDKNKNGKIEPFEWVKYCPSFDARTEL